MLPKYSPVAICPATVAADKIPEEDKVEFQNLKDITKIFVKTLKDIKVLKDVLKTLQDILD